MRRAFLISQGSLSALWVLLVLYASASAQELRRIHYGTTIVDRTPADLGGEGCRLVC